MRFGCSGWSRALDRNRFLTTLPSQEKTNRSTKNLSGRFWPTGLMIDGRVVGGGGGSGGFSLTLADMHVPSPSDTTHARVCVCVCVYHVVCMCVYCIHSH